MATMDEETDTLDDDPCEDLSCSNTQPSDCGENFRPLHCQLCDEDFVAAYCSRSQCRIGMCRNCAAGHVKINGQHVPKDLLRMCDFCHKEFPRKICLDCDKTLGVRCARAHERSKISSSHVQVNSAGLEADIRDRKNQISQMIKDAQIYWSSCESLKSEIIGELEVKAARSTKEVQARKNEAVRKLSELFNEEREDYQHFIRKMDKDIGMCAKVSERGREVEGYSDWLNRPVQRYCPSLNLRKFQADFIFPENQQNSHQLFKWANLAFTKLVETMLFSGALYAVRQLLQ